MTQISISLLILPLFQNIYSSGVVGQLILQARVNVIPSLSLSSTSPSESPDPPALKSHHGPPDLYYVLLILRRYSSSRSLLYVFGLLPLLFHSPDPSTSRTRPQMPKLPLSPRILSGLLSPNAVSTRLDMLELRYP